MLPDGPRGVIWLGPVGVDLHHRTFDGPGGGGRLTETEVRLLRHLARHAGTPVAREVLFSDVWQYHRQVHSRTLDVAVRRLRQKLEIDPGRPRFLRTVRGVGYLLELVHPECLRPEHSRALPARWQAQPAGVVAWARQALPASSEVLTGRVVTALRVLARTGPRQDAEPLLVEALAHDLDSGQEAWLLAESLPFVTGVAFEERSAQAMRLSALAAEPAVTARVLLRSARGWARTARLEEAVETAQTEGLDGLQMQAMGQLATALPPKASERAHHLYLEALALAQRLEDRWEACIIEANFGHFLNGIGLLDEAQRRLQSALSQFVERGDLRNAAFVELNLGLMAYEALQFDSAASYYASAVARGRVLEDVGLVLHCELNVVALATSQGEILEVEAAETLLDRARTAGLWPQEITALQVLGAAWQHAGHPALGRPYDVAALELARRSGDDLLCAGVLGLAAERGLDGPVALDMVEEAVASLIDHQMSNATLARLLLHWRRLADEDRPVWTARLRDLARRLPAVEVSPWTELAAFR